MIHTGIDDFRKVREMNLIYVDKSELISDILASPADTFLFTRPRRFGKSLNLSMLDCFFNMQYNGNRWFDGLKVMDDPKAVSWMNSRPVISFNMKDMPAKNFDLFLSKVSDRIAYLYGGYKYLRDSEMLDDADRRLFEL